MRFVGIPIYSVTSLPGESEHQFWNNPCTKIPWKEINDLNVSTINLSNLLDWCLHFQVGSVDIQSDVWTSREAVYINLPNLLDWCLHFQAASVDIQSDVWISREAVYINLSNLLDWCLHIRAASLNIQSDVWTCREAVYNAGQPL